MRLGVKAVEEGECLKSTRSSVVANVRRVELEGTENLDAGDGLANISDHRAR